MKISVIIPTLNEEKSIHSTLEDLFSRHSPDEVIVVDGGSKDRTCAIAAHPLRLRLRGRQEARQSPQGAAEWARVIPSKKGRAQQMNEGARRATGDVFLFLHADTKLPAAGLERIKEAIQKGAAGGRFRLKFDDRRWLLCFYESYTRFHFFSYGDQGFFVTREIFKRLGGFREEAPFEDIDFYQRLRRVAKPVILKEAVTTSARRFLQTGCLRQKLINLFLVSLHSTGFEICRMKENLYSEIR